MAAIERKRPWYLVLGLLAALAFGANGARSGWGTIMLYHEPIDPSTAVQGIASEADRAVVVARVDAYLHALDAAKARGWPLGVAALVLGLAQLFFAMRALGGSASARAALLQLVVAQAGLNVVSHVLMRDVIAADLRVLQASETANIHEQSLDKPRADEMIRTTDAMLRVASPIVLALQLLGSALIVLSLTRRRARDFFEPPATAVRER
jgi:hypothetical protein